MKTKFKDVANLYLGVEVVNTIGKHMGKIVSASIDGTATINPLDEFKPRVIILNSLKPILRPLSDMTVEEGAWCLKETFFDHVNYPISDFRIELVGLDDNPKNPRISINNDWYSESLTFGNNYGAVWGIGQPAQNVKIKATVFAYLLSRHFDLFGLIQSGEAIDKTKL